MSQLLPSESRNLGHLEESQEAIVKFFRMHRSRPLEKFTKKFFATYFIHLKMKFDYVFYERVRPNGASPELFMLLFFHGFRKQDHECPHYKKKFQCIKKRINLEYYDLNIY